MISNNSKHSSKVDITGPFKVSQNYRDGGKSALKAVSRVSPNMEAHVSMLLATTLMSIYPSEFV